MDQYHTLSKQYAATTPALFAHLCEEKKVHLIGRHNTSAGPSRTGATGLISRRQALTAQGEMTPGNIQLAAYVVARQAVGRQVEASELEILKTATHILENAHRHMWHKRGNVRVDIEATNHLSTRMVEGVRAGVNEMLKQQADRPSPSECTGVFAFFGAGNCSELASVAQHFLLKHRLETGGLNPTERIEYHANKRIKHGWLVWQASYSITLDPWTRSSAINTYDAKNTMFRVGYTVQPDVIATQANASQMANDFDHGITKTAPAWRSCIEGHVQRFIAESYVYPPHEVKEESSAVSASFAKQAKYALDGITLAPDDTPAADLGATQPEWQAHFQMRLNVRNQLKAAHVAMSLGASLAEGASQASYIVQEAQRLAD
jgi:hypothetical protein